MGEIYKYVSMKAVLFDKNIEESIYVNSKVSNFSLMNTYYVQTASWKVTIFNDKWNIWKNLLCTLVLASQKKKLS